MDYDKWETFYNRIFTCLFMVKVRVLHTYDWGVNPTISVMSMDMLAGRDGFSTSADYYSASYGEQEAPHPAENDTHQEDTDDDPEKV